MFAKISDAHGERVARSVAFTVFKRCFTLEQLWLPSITSLARHTQMLNAFAHHVRICKASSATPDVPCHLSDFASGCCVSIGVLAVGPMSMPGAVLSRMG